MRESDEKNVYEDWRGKRESVDGTQVWSGDTHSLIYSDTPGGQ